MAADTRVAMSGGAIQGEKGSAEDSFDRGGGVRKDWWWDDGPVDSCCCCCSLHAGVGLLSAIDLLSGLWCTFFMSHYLVSRFERLLSTMQSQYALDCGGSAASAASCVELKESMDRAAGDIQLFLHLPLVIYVQGAWAILAGAVGLWAIGQKRSTWAVMAYMKSWPLRLVLGVLVALRVHSLRDKYHVPADSDGTYWLIYTCLVVYYFKVSWSYYKRRLDHEERPYENVDHDDTTGASSDRVGEEERMLPMNPVSSV